MPQTTNLPLGWPGAPRVALGAGNLLDAFCQGRNRLCRQGRKNREGPSPTPPAGRFSRPYAAVRREGDSSRQLPGLTTRRPSVVIVGWDALEEGKNAASDLRFDGRGTASEKFYWRPVAPPPNLRVKQVGRPVCPAVVAGAAPAASLATMPVEWYYRDRGRSRHGQEIGRCEPQNAALLVLGVVARATSTCFQENYQPERTSALAQKQQLVPRPARGVGQVLFCAPLGKGSWSGLGSATPFCYLLRLGSQSCVAAEHCILICSESARPAFSIRLTRCESISPYSCERCSALVFSFQAAKSSATFREMCDETFCGDGVCSFLQFQGAESSATSREVCDEKVDCRFSGTHFGVWNCNR